MARQALSLFKKDLITELREARHFVSVLIFGLLLLLIFSFALSVDPDLMNKMAPGLFWLAVLFSSLLSLDHSFRRETEEGQWEGLLLLGSDPKAIYLGKMAANLTLLLTLQLFLLPLMTILFDIVPTLSLGIVLFLGSLGIAALGTFYSGLTASFREGHLLLPLLLFPMLVPLLLAAVHATEMVLVRDVFGQQIAWLKLLIVFDIIFLLGSVLCADFLFDGA